MHCTKNDWPNNGFGYLLTFQLGNICDTFRLFCNSYASLIFQAKEFLGWSKILRVQDRKKYIMWHVMVKNNSFFQRGWQCKGYAENKAMITSSITSAIAANQPPK